MEEMADAVVVPDFDEVVQGYLDDLLRSIPGDAPYVERRLISDEKWQRYAGDDGFRYSGLLREYEPDLHNVLENRRLVIIGEPGAGKSTVAQITARRFANARSRTDIPVFLNLRGYAGDLSASLAGSAPREVLISRAIVRRYILDGLDEVP